MSKKEQLAWRVALFVASAFLLIMMIILFVVVIHSVVRSW
jgi:hypothetical protein